MGRIAGLAIQNILRTTATLIHILILNSNRTEAGATKDAQKPNKSLAQMLFSSRFHHQIPKQSKRFSFSIPIIYLCQQLHLHSSSVPSIFCNLCQCQISSPCKQRLMSSCQTLCRAVDDDNHENQHPHIRVRNLRDSMENDNHNAPRQSQGL